VDAWALAGPCKLLARLPQEYKFYSVKEHGTASSMQSTSSTTRTRPIAIV
jgi:hypothetical protein